jgi:hypothetical protein
MNKLKESQLSLESLLNLVQRFIATIFHNHGDHSILTAG